MAANIPAKLKAADLTRFCVRAAQLATVKPVASYWCEYWIANQILSKGLHTADNETLLYTTDLMDKLERTKSENATNDAIMDDMAGQAYIEQFASETFDRADRAVRANKVTKQTADTFQAAATFFELINIWGPPDEETQAKIKYAKWNAVRIARALKDGKDPNESNPKPQPEEEKPVSPLDPTHLDERQTSISDASRHATVQDMPEEEDHFAGNIAAQSSINQDNDRSGSPGGDILPNIPIRRESESALPTTPRDEAIDLGLPSQPSFDPASQTAGQDDGVSPLEPSIVNNRSDSGGSTDLPDIPASRPGDWTHPNPPPAVLPGAGLPPPPTRPSDVQDYFPNQPPQTHTPLFNIPHHYAQHSVPPPAAAQPVPALSGVTHGLRTDDAAITQAQKHAKWAISALNFEDAETAVKELREAIRALGGEA